MTYMLSRIVKDNFFDSQSERSGIVIDPNFLWTPQTISIYLKDDLAVRANAPTGNGSRDGIGPSAMLQIELDAGNPTSIYLNPY